MNDSPHGNAAPSDFELTTASPGGVHVVLVGANLVCRNCALAACVAMPCGQPGLMLRHLLRHVEAGHRVRRGVLEGLAVASAVLAPGRLLHAPRNTASRGNTSSP